jgi:hypothetical protein
MPGNVPNYANQLLFCERVLLKIEFGSRRPKITFDATRDYFEIKYLRRAFFSVYLLKLREVMNGTGCGKIRSVIPVDSFANT